LIADILGYNFTSEVCINNTKTKIHLQLDIL